MKIVCLDLEGVLVPEIWIGVAERTGIEELRLTTRDISDYDVLMKRRLEILADQGLGIGDIHEVIDSLDPLPGALEFLDALRAGEYSPREYVVSTLSLETCARRYADLLRGGGSAQGGGQAS